jgi:hypothetical protein
MVTLRTYFDSSSTDELCFHVHYLPNHMMRGVHVCEVASIQMVIDWEIHPASGFVRFTYHRHGDTQSHQAYGRIVCNDVVPAHLDHMTLVQSERHRSVQHAYRIERLFEGVRCSAAAGAQAAAAAAAAAATAKSHAVGAKGQACAVAVVMSLVSHIAGAQRV